jgi:hypothetical protein
MSPPFWGKSKKPPITGRLCISGVVGQHFSVWRNMLCSIQSIQLMAAILNCDFSNKKQKRFKKYVEKIGYLGSKNKIFSVILGVILDFNAILNFRKKIKRLNSLAS